MTAEDLRWSWAKLNARAGRPGAEVGEQIREIVAKGNECRLVFRGGQLDPLALATFKVIPSGREDDEAFGDTPSAADRSFTRAADPIRAGSMPCLRRTAPYGLRAGHPNQPRLTEVRLLRRATPSPTSSAERSIWCSARSPARWRKSTILGRRTKISRTPRLEAVVSGRDLNVQTLPSRRIYYLAVNHAYRPSAETPASRRACCLRHSQRTDPDRLLSRRLHGRIIGARRSVPPNTWPCSPLVVKGRSTTRPGQKASATPPNCAAVGKDWPGRTRELKLKYPAGDPLIEKACKMICEQVEAVKPEFTLTPVAVPPEKLWKQIEFDNDFDLAFRHYDYADDWFSLSGLLDPSAPPGHGSRNFMAYKPSEFFGPVLARCQDRRDFGELREAMHKLHAEFVEELPFIPLWHLDTHVLMSQKLETRPPAAPTGSAAAVHPH